MRESLLDHTGFDNSGDLLVPERSVVLVVDDHLEHRQALRIGRCLWDESIWRGESQDSAHKRRAAEKEEVLESRDQLGQAVPPTNPVEASRALDGEASRLGHHGRDVVVKVEEEGDQTAKGERSKDPLDG